MVRKFMKIIEWLKLPEITGIENLDDPAITLLHAEIIQKKPFLKKIYIDFYEQFKKSISNSEEKTLVELGSGGGFIKEVISNMITSDVLEFPNVDKVLSVLDMPFEEASVDAFFMFDVLHHIADPRAFFKEALRCLKVGGKVVMIEPANTLWSRFIYKNFHHEAFDTQAQMGLSGAGNMGAGTPPVLARPSQDWQGGNPAKVRASFRCKWCTCLDNLLARPKDIRKRISGFKNH